MRQPKTPPAVRIAAANMIIDRGYGKAAQLLAIDGEIRQLVEVKLSVVPAAMREITDESRLLPSAQHECDTTKESV